MWPRTRPIWSPSEIEEPLPVLLDATAALGEFSAGSNTEPTILSQGYGDVDAALRGAHAVIELELSVGRHSGVPLETRGAIGRYDASRDMLELHGAAKVPHRIRDLLARACSTAPRRQSTSTSRTSAAASASAASSTPRTCWYASRRCAWGGR